MTCHTPTERVLESLEHDSDEDHGRDEDQHAYQRLGRHIVLPAPHRINLSACVLNRKTPFFIRPRFEATGVATMKRSKGKKPSLSADGSSGLRFTAYASEDHRSPLYSVSFCDQGEGRGHHFAVVGSNQVRARQSARTHSGYECFEWGHATCALGRA